MSSMRNAVQRRNHKERSQPEERKKWGLLEKHKDYSARARDFNAKKTKLKALRQKIIEKNPDEFYFGMMSSKGPSTAATGGRNRTGTVNGDRGNKALSQEAVRLFKTQDLGYVRTVRNQVQREVERLRQGVVGIETGGKKTVFLNNEEEMRELRGEDVEGAEWDDDDEDDDEDEDMFSDEDFEEDEEVKEAISETAEQRRLRKLREKERGKLESRLQAAEERLKALTQAEEALDLQRAKMAKTTTVGGVNKNGVKFKVRERKR